MSRVSGDGICDCQRAVRVPDRAFRSFLIDNGYAVKRGWQKMTPTDNGCALKALKCYEKEIHSLRGIEMFPQLEQLTCGDNPIKKLDLNALPNLQQLYGYNMPLQRIDIDSCHHLRHIELSFTLLDTFNLAHFPELEFFFCIFSPLSYIDLATCTALKSLYIRGTQIETVDIRPCRDIMEIHALDTPLQTIITTTEQYERIIKVSVEDSVRIEFR
jgi:hypothetical protein